MLTEIYVIYIKLIDFFVVVVCLLLESRKGEGAINESPEYLIPGMSHKQSFALAMS